MRKKIAILGSTGSIGKSTLDIIRKDKKNFEIVFLSANNSYKKLIQQAKEFNAKNVIINNKLFYKKVKNLLKKNKTKVYSGDISITNIISGKLDYTMSAIVGVAGLQPTLDAIKVSKTVAIANKESIICGWDLLSKLIKRYKTKILPVDSEHFSIMELTKDISDDEIEEIIITASGGPFLNTPKNKVNKVSPAQAVNHPNWKMGKKISVDSATMMNKGLEVIEAKWLFKIDSEKIDILVHPEGIVHSLVEFEDASLLAQMSVPDMKIPIAYGLGFPERIRSNSQRLSLEKIEQLNFCKPDLKKFPSIRISRASLDSGGTSPSLLNAANEEAVRAFLDKKICFTQITEIISFVMDTIPIKTVKELENIFQADTLARKSALTRIHQLRS